MNNDKPMILIVDDHSENRLLFMMHLGMTNYQFYECCHGAEAVELTKRLSFDLVLMDIRMPVMNGLEATKAIRTVNKDLPIIVCTANHGDEYFDKSFDAGANDFIRKPMRKNELVKRVEACIANYSSKKQLVRQLMRCRSYISDQSFLDSLEI